MIYANCGLASAFACGRLSPRFVSVIIGAAGATFHSPHVPQPQVGVVKGHGGHKVDPKGQRESVPADLWNVPIFQPSQRNSKTLL